MSNKGLRSSPLVSVVVLSYNSKRFLRRCLESVLGNDYPNFEVIFIDNGSDDKSLDYVESMFGSDSRIRKIALNRNYGYCEGNNIAARHANEGAKYIVFLNPDVVVKRDWLTELIVAMEFDPMIGIAQSLILNYNEPHLIQCAGLYIIDYCGWTWSLLRNNPGSVNNKLGQIEIFAALGASLIIRRDLFFRVGCFDSQFFMYSDETDLAWRVWLNGYKVKLAPRSIIYHALGGSSEMPEEFKSIFVERHRNKNVIRMLIKNYDLKHLFLYLPIAITLMYLRAVYYFINRDRSPLLGFVQAIAWNIVHLNSTLQKRWYVQKMVKKVSYKNLQYLMRKRLPFHVMLKRMI